MKRVLTTLMVLGIAVGLPVLADEVDNGIYIGAGIGQGQLETEAGTIPVDGDDTAWKAAVGWRIFNYLGVEANWVDFGTADDTSGATVTEVTADGLDLAAMGFIPIGSRFEIFGKIGYIAWDAELDSSSTPTTDANDDGEDLMWGAGAAFRIGRGFRIRAEYEDFDIDGLDTAQFISAGATFTF